jgi:hypothetical protein
MQLKPLCPLLIVSLISASTFAATSAPTTSPWNPKDFPISFWCAPDAENTTLERYQQIKEAGFTLVMPPCGGAAMERFASLRMTSNGIIP